MDDVKNPVDSIYEDLIGKGYTQKDAAKEAQAKTGISLVTKEPIRAKQLKFTSKGATYGEQNTLPKRGYKFNVFD